MERYVDIHLSDEDIEDAKGKMNRERIEKFVFENRWKLTIFILGILFLGFAVFLYRLGVFEGNKIEIIESGQKTEDIAKAKEAIAEISGAVEKPGVYRLLASDRVERLLIEAGGLSAEADREWVEKNLNRAAKIVDGQKFYIPSRNEVGIKNYELGSTRTGSVAGVSSGLVNLNTASASELDGLPGIGAVRAQAIIDNRPYSSPEELLGKKIIPQSVYEKIKDKIIAP